MSEYKNLIKKINSTANIGIIGLGYVGLPLAIRFAEEQHRVFGFDIDPKKVKLLNSSRSYIKHIPNSRIKKLKAFFTFTCDISNIENCDVVIVCVPTPLTKNREPDLSFLKNTANSMVDHIKKGQLFCIESTTFPGTTEEIMLPIIEKSGFEVGKDIFLAYSPEREDPGNKNYSTSNIPKVVGGITDQCLNLASKIYSKVIDEVVKVSSTQTAEMTKLLENIYRSVNIGLVNEMKMVADKMDIDIYEVINAASTKPFGYTPYYPGPGLGGHCIPIDPFYLTWKAREFDIHTRFIELAGEVNTHMPFWVIEKVINALNKAKKSINGAKILVLGVAYKKNVDDMRESPALHIINSLINKGGQVDYADPHIPEVKNLRTFKHSLKSIKLTKSSLSKYDLVLLTTDHDAFNYKLIQENSRLIVDSRGRFSKKLKNLTRA